MLHAAFLSCAGEHACNNPRDHPRGFLGIRFGCGNQKLCVHARPHTRTMPTSLTCCRPHLHRDWAPPATLRRDWAPPATSAPGLASSLPICTGTGLRTCRICPWTGLVAATAKQQCVSAHSLQLEKWPTLSFVLPGRPGSGARAPTTEGPMMKRRGRVTNQIPLMKQGY